MADFLSAARAYLDYVNAPERMAESDNEKTLALIGLLDALAVHVQWTDEGPAEADAPEAREAFEDLYARLSRHFPTFGWYASLLDLDLANPEGKIGAGDAIDDLADIARDLGHVLSLADIAGEDDARHEFNFLYRIHWGRHLRDVQLYLHRYLTGT